MLNLHVQTNGAYSLSIAFFGNDMKKPLAPIGEEWEVRIDTIGPTDIGCAGMRREMSTRRDENNYLGKSDQVTGQGTTQNRSEGKSTGHSIGPAGVITDLEFEWKLQRHVRQ